MKSGINTLVLELCPNGVEKKPLTELAYYEKTEYLHKMLMKTLTLA